MYLLRTKNIPVKSLSLIFINTERAVYQLEIVDKLMKR